MARRKQIWTIGDVFSIPLDDGEVVAGQVIGQEPQALNSATIAVFDAKSGATAVDPEALDSEGIFAKLFVTRDLLDSGVWHVVGHRSPLVPEGSRPYEDLRGRGFIGARIHGSANVTAFVNAFYGLRPWDAWHDPNYLDQFLVSMAKKPVGRLIYEDGR